MKLQTTLVCLSLGILSASSYSEDLPDVGFPQKESMAHSMALSELMGKGYRAVHQTVGVYSPSNGVILIQEYWIDLPTKDRKETLRTLQAAAGEKNPLARFQDLLATPPTHSMWRTTAGVMTYKPDETQWVPVLSKTESPLANVFKRMKREWYLWPGAPVSGLCCGGGTSDEKKVDGQMKLYHDRLARVAAGLDSTRLKERDGLVEEISVMQGEVLSLFVTNEYLRESPVSLDAKAAEELRKKSNVALLPYAKPPKAPAKGYGLLVVVGPEGAEVRDVHETSQAHLAGVSPGDKLISIDGQVVKGQEAKALSDLFHKSDHAQIVFQRPNGNVFSVSLTNQK